MTRFLYHFDRLVAWMSTFASTVAWLAIVVMAIGVTANSVARYAFNSPFMFVDEYAQYLLVVIFYFGLGRTLRAGKHVSVDMLVDKFGKRKRTVIRIITSVLSLGTILVMCYYSWTGAISTYRAGIVSLTPMQTPLFLPFFAVAVGMTIFTLEMAAAIAHDVVVLRDLKKQSGTMATVDRVPAA